MRELRSTAGAAVLALTLTACAGSASTSVAYGPVETWDAAGIESYTFTIERFCFCPMTGPLMVTVVDGEIASVTKRGKEIDLDSDVLQGLPLTVDALFLEAERAQAQADDVAVSYDPDLGYPTRISIDRWRDAIDDEVAYEVGDLRAIQG